MKNFIWLVLFSISIVLGAQVGTIEVVDSTPSGPCHTKQVRVGADGSDIEGRKYCCDLGSNTWGPCDMDIPTTTPLILDGVEPGFTTDKVEVYLQVEDGGDGEGGSEDFTGLIFDSVLPQSGFAFGMWDTNGTSSWTDVDFINNGAGIVSILDPGYPQLACHYDASNYASFQVTSSGDLNVTPSGGDTKFFGAGGLSTNSGNITSGADLISTDATTVGGTFTVDGAGPHTINGRVNFEDQIFSHDPANAVILNRGDVSDSSVWIVGQARNQLVFPGQDPDVAIDCATGTTTPAISNCTAALDSTGYAMISNSGLDNGDVAVITITDSDGFEAFSHFDQDGSASFPIRSFAWLSYRGTTNLAYPDSFKIEASYSNSDGAACESAACPFVECETTVTGERGYGDGDCSFDSPAIDGSDKLYGVRITLTDWQNTTNDAYFGNFVFANWAEFVSTTSVPRYDPNNRFPMLDDVCWKDTDGEHCFGWDNTNDRLEIDGVAVGFASATTDACGQSFPNSNRELCLFKSIAPDGTMTPVNAIADVGATIGDVVFINTDGTPAGSYKTSAQFSYDDNGLTTFSDGALDTKLTVGCISTGDDCKVEMDGDATTVDDLIIGNVDGRVTIQACRSPAICTSGTPASSESINMLSDVFIGTAAVPKDLWVYGDTNILSASTLILGNGSAVDVCIKWNIDVAQWLCWHESDDRFWFSNDLEIDGGLVAGSADPKDAETYIATEDERWKIYSEALAKNVIHFNPNPANEAYPTDVRDGSDTVATLDPTGQNWAFKDWTFSGESGGSFNGNVNLSGGTLRLQSGTAIYLSPGTETPAGSTCPGTAEELSYINNFLSTVTGSDNAVKLPSCSIPYGETYWIWNLDATDSANVCPASGEDIGAGTNTAISLAAGDLMKCVCRASATASCTTSTID